jgi:hypothetical protein
MIRRILAVCAAFAASASIAGAQQTQLPAELGIDAGASIGFDAPRVTVISIPVPAVRLGFYLNDRVSVEPKVGFQSVHDNTGTSTDFSAQVGVLFHFENNPVGRGLYVRPFVGILGEKATGYSETRTVVGGGLGVKEPFANRFASRLEVNYSHVSAVTDEPAANNLGILFGISVFSR